MANFVKLKNEDDFSEFIGTGKRIVLKHSRLCPISYSVKSDVNALNSDIGLVVVQASRELSNHIAEVTGVRHESPQALVFEDGACVYSASHYDVESAKLSEWLDG